MGTLKNRVKKLIAQRSAKADTLPENIVWLPCEDGSWIIPGYNVVLLANGEFDLANYNGKLDIIQAVNALKAADALPGCHGDA